MNRQDNRIAIEISKENEAHVAENRILKEQNQIDENVRNDLEKQALDRDLAKDELVDSEKKTKRTEYGQFLLQQIEDKEKEKKERHSPEIRGNAYVYSEEMLAPELRRNLKLTKQQEMRKDLDECIRMKNVLKEEKKQKEIEEERGRVDFLKKRDSDEAMVREQAKQQIEDKELQREEATRQWKWNNTKDDEREQFIDSLMKKDITLSQQETTDPVTVKEVRVEDDPIVEQVQTTEIEEESTESETNEVDWQDD